MDHVNPTDEALRELLEGAATIAIVGASSKPARPSHDVMRTLLEAGFHVIPVNPGETEVLGQRAYPSLAAVPLPIDIVDVFRRSEETPAIADEAVRIGARVLWLQLGVVSDEAARRAGEGGLTVVMDLCTAQTVRRLGITRRGAVSARDVVDEAGIESFPASDPPEWTPLHIGGPRKA